MLTATGPIEPGRELPALVQIVRSGADPYVATLAVWALAKIGNREALNYLREATGDASAIFRRAAHEALAAAGLRTRKDA